MKILLVGGPADGRELERETLSERLFVPQYDPNNPVQAVWAEEGQPMAVYDPNPPHADDPPYWICADGKYRQRRVIDVEYRLEETPGGHIYRYFKTWPLTQKVYNPATKEWTMETTP